MLWSDFYFESYNLLCEEHCSCQCLWGGRVSQWVRSLDLTAHTSLSPIRRGFVPSFVNYKKGCARLAATSDNVYQLLAQGQWFSPGTPASSTTKTGCHDIAEILLKVVLNTKIQIQIPMFMLFLMWKYQYEVILSWTCLFGWEQGCIPEHLCRLNEYLNLIFIVCF